MKRLKYILWKLGLLKDKFPYCGKELMKHGFAGHNEYFTCRTENCEFGAGN